MRRWVAAGVAAAVFVVIAGLVAATYVRSAAQPVLAIASALLLAWALRTRLAAERRCRLPGTGSVGDQEPVR